MVQVTCKPSGPTGQMEMEKGPIGTLTRKPSGPIGRMQKGPIGTRRMDKGPSGDFYDEFQASWKSNRAVPSVHVGWRKD